MADLSVPAAQVTRRAFRRVRGLALEAAGGPARGRVVLILAGVLALSGADTGTISAITGHLEQVFKVGNTEIGVLWSVVALVAAVFTIPAGIFTDRTRRNRLLAGSIVLWAVATALSGAATSYTWLLVARVALGAVNATAGPAVASLTGDFFPAADRGRIYGLILGGDLVGSGIGYIISGDISNLTSWRAAFLWLVPPTLALAWVVWRLPEPARGGSSSIAAGDKHIFDGREARSGECGAGAASGGCRSGGLSLHDRDGLAEQALSDTGVQPRRELVLRRDPTSRSLWWAVRYVLRIRTNVVLIIASALGFFFFAGLRSFAIIFATRHYGISTPTATALMIIIGAGGLAGVFAGGRVADRMLRRGRVTARVLVPAVCLLALPPVLAPAIVSTSVAVALPLLTAGAVLLGALNPPLDAARLDIMHPRLWGRAEAIRTVLRSLGEATAPIAFGYVSQYVFAGPGSAAAGGTSGGTAGGLEYAFLIFLTPLIIAGLLTLAAMRSYPRDMATASASVQVIGDGARQDGRDRLQHATLAGGQRPADGPGAGDAGRAGSWRSAPPG